MSRFVWLLWSAPNFLMKDWILIIFASKGWKLSLPRINRFLKKSRRQVESHVAVGVSHVLRPRCRRLPEKQICVYSVVKQFVQMFRWYLDRETRKTDLDLYFRPPRAVLHKFQHLLPIARYHQLFALSAKIIISSHKSPSALLKKLYLIYCTGILSEKIVTLSSI